VYIIDSDLTVSKVYARENRNSEGNQEAEINYVLGSD
jgi:hypothetical protein